MQWVMKARNAPEGIAETLCVIACQRMAAHWSAGSCCTAGCTSPTRPSASGAIFWVPRPM